MTEPMTPDKLRDIAWTLDFMQGLLLSALECPDIEWVIGDVVVPDDKVSVLKSWLEGTDMQDDLRAWADRF